MHPVQSLLPVLQVLDDTELSPISFSTACLRAGWPEPQPDGIGLWEIDDPVEGTTLILDTVTSPTTLICRLECDDAYEPEALQHTSLRQQFDSAFASALAVLRTRFPDLLVHGSYEPPFNWQFAHFRASNLIVALEQSHYDPIMGVQLLLLVQALPRKPLASAITATW